MPDNDLAQLQSEIDEQLDKARIGWIRLATADFDLKERTAICDDINSNEALLMALLERKWALRTTLFGSGETFMMRAKWILEMHYSGDGKDSLITTDNFDDFADVERKINQNREMQFVVKPPATSSARELQILDDMKNSGLKIELGARGIAIVATELRTPNIGVCDTPASIGRWFKRVGDPVSLNEPLVEIETDGVALEVSAPATGVLSNIHLKDGETVKAGALLGIITEFEIGKDV